MNMVKQQRICIYLAGYLLFPQTAVAGGGEIGYLIYAYMAQFALIGAMLGFLSMKTSISKSPKKHFVISTIVLVSAALVDVVLPFFIASVKASWLLSWIADNDNYLRLIVLFPVCVGLVTVYFIKDKKV